VRQGEADVNLSLLPSFSPSVNNSFKYNENFNDLPKLSSTRIVNSISTQTQSLIPLCTNQQTQTCNENFNVNELCVASPSQNNCVNEQFICNVSEDSNPLPLIMCQFKTNEATFLIDTGSSISILGSELFQKLKGIVKYKHLASVITIKTLNSSVSFSACINISFKINGIFCKHPVYIVDLPERSKFKGILGNDFILQNRLVIDSYNNVVSIRGKTVQLICDKNVVNNSNPMQQNTQVNNIQIFDNEQTDIISVYLQHKVILQPNTSAYVKVYMNNNIFNEHMIFSIDARVPNLDSTDVIVSLPISNNTEGTQTSNKTVHFYVYMSNPSAESVHLNKGAKIGNLHHVEHIQNVNDTNLVENDNFNDKSDNNENDDAREKNVNDDAHDHFCFLIQASQEVLDQRKHDLSPNDFNLSHLSTQESSQLLKILLQNYSAFSKSSKTLGHTDKIIPEIKFTNEYPVKTLPYPIPYSLQKECKDQIDQLCEANIIEKNLSSWSCPILLVKKKSIGSEKPKYRIAMDLRMLNSLIEGSSYPLPKISTIISNLSNYSFFTSLDLQQAYHQINLPEHLQDKLTFTSMFGSYKYKRLVFGLKTAASIFQALIDSIIDEVNIPGIFAYQDDLIFGSNSFHESKEKLAKILEVLSKYNLTLAPSKCTFHNNSTDYLGFHIENHNITPISANIEKIMSFPVPKTRKQLRRFIGLATFYKHLIPSFSAIIQPLIDLTSPKARFIWSEVQQCSFEKIQNIFLSTPNVMLPDWSKTFYLSTDASGIAIAGALQQLVNGELKPIAYFSKSLNTAEKNYPALKLELMAIFKSVLAFKYYLYNRNFVILSDSKPLKNYKKVKNPADITTRWMLELSEYSFTFQHVPGKTNVLADYLSREDFSQNKQDIVSNPQLILQKDSVVPVVDNDYVSSHSNQPNVQQNQGVNVIVTDSQNSNSKDPLLEISDATFVNAQINDKKLAPIYNQILQFGKYSKDERYFIQPDSKVLMIKSANNFNRDFSYLIVVPHSLKAKVLRINHLSHFGFKKTYEFVKRKYYWQGSYCDTVNFVASCVKCLQTKHHNIPNAPFQPTSKPKLPNQIVSIDLVGPFQCGSSILTVIDHFSRHLELFPLRSTTTNVIVQCLLQYFAAYGRPTILLSDLGKQFTSQIHEQFLKILGIKIAHSSAGHPQANAISERVNTSIKYSINTLLQEGYNFKQAIAIHKNLYNGSTHSSTNFSPNLLHFGRELSLLFDTVNFSYLQPHLDNVEMYKYLTSLQGIYNKAYKNSKISQDVNYRRQHKSAKLRNLNLHDIVYLKSMDKYKQSYSGPFEIVQKHSPVSYTIRRQSIPSARSFRVHVDRIILAPPRNEYLCDENNVSPMLQSSPTNQRRYDLRPRL
jgi:transposase InsO family protein